MVDDLKLAVLVEDFYSGHSLTILRRCIFRTFDDTTMKRIFTSGSDISLNILV